MWTCQWLSLMPRPHHFHVRPFIFMSAFRSQHQVFHGLFILLWLGFQKKRYCISFCSACCFFWDEFDQNTPDVFRGFLPTGCCLVFFSSQLLVVDNSYHPILRILLRQVEMFEFYLWQWPLTLVKISVSPLSKDHQPNEMSAWETKKGVGVQSTTVPENYHSLWQRL